jgi:hypothetical protein
VPPVKPAFINALFPTVFIFSPRVRSPVRPVHFKKAFSPIKFTLAGKVTVPVNLEQLPKVAGPIF